MKLKIIKLFEEYSQENFPDIEKSILKNLQDKIVSVGKSNGDGTFDLEGGLVLDNVPNLVSLKQIFPFKIRYIKGGFAIKNCKDLESLENCPVGVSGKFIISNCPNIHTLEFSPTKVTGDVIIDTLPIQSLNGVPQVGGNLILQKLPNLVQVDSIEIVNGNLTFKDCPKISSDVAASVETDKNIETVIINSKGGNQEELYTGATSATATISKLKQEEIEKNYQTKSLTWDEATNEKIKTLHPSMVKPAVNFINQVEKELGIKLRITSGYRSSATQNQLYAKGRTIDGNVVTNAKGGQSYHNYGLAIDVVEIKDGKPNWKTDWEAIARIGKENGFEWGGDFKSIIDKPHFQLSHGYSTSQLAKLSKDKETFQNLA